MSAATCPLTSCFICACDSFFKELTCYLVCSDLRCCDKQVFNFTLVFVTAHFTELNFICLDETIILGNDCFYTENFRHFVFVLLYLL